MQTDLSTTLTNALAGLQVGVKKARLAAGEVAKLTLGSKSVQDTIKPLIGLQRTKEEVEVSTKIVKVEDDILGRFIDEKV